MKRSRRHRYVSKAHPLNRILMRGAVFSDIDGNCIALCRADGLRQRSVGSQVDDLAVVRLGVVPFMLEGYRESAEIDEDASLEARILWRQLQLGQITLPRGPLPGRSWAERPLTMLLDTLEFFASHRRPRSYRELATWSAKRKAPHSRAASACMWRLTGIQRS